MRASRIDARGSWWLLAAFLTACGGGGGGSTATPVVNPLSQPTNPAITLPASSTVNLSTTYTVYENASGGTPQVAITALNAAAPSGTGWTLVTTGAYVFYPDGSVQVTDALGNFDASQSSWALANQTVLAANPNANPEVIVSLPYTSPQIPLDTTVVAYTPTGGATLTAGVFRDANGMRRAAGGSAPVSELTSITLYPRGVAMFDNESRTFTVVGSDSDGDYVNLKSATVTWTLGGCGASSGAGTVTISSADNARATYKPPATGTFATPDLVTATVTANGTTYCAAANAFYYDVSSGVQISGTLANASSQPVANGIVSFYGGGREFYRGNLVAVTNGSGTFSRTLPPNRTMTLVGGQSTVSGGKPSQATWYNLSPNSVSAGASGTTIAAATYTETTPFQNPFKPLPPIDRAIRDGYELSEVTTDNFPFNRPNSTGKFQKCSIDAIINNNANSTGTNACATVAAGDYFGGWAVTYLPSATAPTSWIFTQPSTQEGGRHVLQLTSVTSVTIPNGISDANTAGLTCTSTPCWTFAEFYNPTGFTAAVTALINESSPGTTLAGTILANDGGFNENVGGTGAFQVYMVRNEYSVGHQTPGSPLFTHTLSFNFASGGATTASVANNWYNGAGAVEGTLSYTRTPDTSDPGFTLSATGTRTYFKGGQAAVSIGYSVAGSFNQNNDHSGTLTVTLTSVSGSDQSAVNSTASYTFVAPGGSCPSGYPAAQNGTTRICGQIVNPNLNSLANNLGTNVVADFTVDSAYYVNVILDANLGGQKSTFHL